MDAEEDGPTWSDIAGWYDDLLSGGSGPHELATATTLSLVPPVPGLNVLDVACGQGMATRALARAGAGRVTGTDSSPELVNLAECYERDDPLGIGYVVDDARSLTTVEDASVDVVTCQLGLMDIAGLDAALAAVHRVLVPGGSFVFVIGHPCFLAPDAFTTEGAGTWGRFVGSYLEDRFWRSTNPDGVRRVGNFHRTLSTYVNAILRAGFVLDELAEPPATRQFGRSEPVYLNVPIFLGARCRRPAG